MGTLEQLKARVSGLEKQVNALPAGDVLVATVQAGITAAQLEEMRAVVDGQARRRGESHAIQERQAASVGAHEVGDEGARGRGKG